MMGRRFPLCVWLSLVGVMMLWMGLQLVHVSSNTFPDEPQGVLPVIHSQSSQHIAFNQTVDDNVKSVVTRVGNNNSDSTTIGDLKQTLPFENTTAQEWQYQYQPGVVIVSKIHGSDYVPMLQQSLCLLHQAYNRHLLYDIVVFTTEPIPMSTIETLTQTVHPARLSVVQDNQGLQTEIANLSEERRSNFLQSCNVSDPANLTWWSKCPDRLAYNWQAEFRSLHIWTHPALQAYRWMMWLDADAFCSQVWKRDPIAIAVTNNLTLFYGNFPQGFTAGKEIQSRIEQSFGRGPLCQLEVASDGRFSRTVGPACGNSPGLGFSLVHGYFHISNLDFFRSDIVQQWMRNLIGNGFLQRKFDDQVAVTVPTAILTPSHAWLMRSVGVDLLIHHNGKLDGKWKAGGFKRRWNNKGGKELFPQAVNVCDIVSGG
eukprot:Nitzschia sp. Nitz4//scaffold93_size78505//17305//18585//NITZ4_005415-RA/size78505-processed-gene-0.84-mRNA-1//1//CDS//3329560273//2902//frame0